MNTKKNGNISSRSGLMDSFLNAWSQQMDSYEVGKYSQELDAALAAYRKNGSGGGQS